VLVLDKVLQEFLKYCKLKIINEKQIHCRFIKSKALRCRMSCGLKRLIQFTQFLVEKGIDTISVTPSSMLKKLEQFISVKVKKKYYDVN